MVNEQPLHSRVENLLRQIGVNPYSGVSFLDQIDSLKILTFMTILEDEFTIEVGAFEVVETNFENMEQLSAYIQKKQAAR